MSKEKDGKESLVSFGAGVAVGSLVTGALKALLGIVVATGVGYTAYKLVSDKEPTQCKCGQKQK